MRASDQIALEDIPDLKMFGLRLDGILTPWFERRILFDLDDPLSIMHLGFLSKQREHLRSVFALGDARCDRDCFLIARTALEGLAILMWALKDPEERAERWHSYGYVMELRLMTHSEEQGQHLPHEEWEWVNQGLAQYGRRFIRSQFKNKQKKDLPRDCYEYEWLNIKAKTLLAEAGADSLYRNVYQTASAWGHWNVYLIVDALGSEGDDINYERGGPVWVATAYAVGFQALFQTTELVMAHFHKQFGDDDRDQIAQLRFDFDQRFAGVKARIEAESRKAGIV